MSELQQGMAYEFRLCRKENEELRAQLAAHEAAVAKAKGKPSAGFTRDEEWLREVNCEVAGQAVGDTVEAIGYAMEEINRLRLVIASQSRELAELRERTEARIDDYQRVHQADEERAAFLQSELAAKDAELARLRDFHRRVDNACEQASEGYEHVTAVVMLALDDFEALDRAQPAQVEQDCGDRGVK